jgi:hypothetical protein
MSQSSPECNFNASAASPPLQLDADFRINTDTGATSHMTPHRHWLHEYTPYVVPIKLANGGVVYSQGIGSIRFVVNGVWLGPVQFSRVLHVPALCSNLLSILYLTRLHNWECSINATTLTFKHDGVVRFTASIYQNNAGYLNGHVEECTNELANPSSSINATPLSQELWHRRCVHPVMPQSRSYPLWSLVWSLTRKIHQIQFVNLVLQARCMQILFLLRLITLLCPFIAFTLIYMRRKRVLPLVIATE